MHSEKLVNVAEGKLPFAVISLFTILTVSASDLVMSAGWGISVIVLGLAFFGSWLLTE